MIREIYKKAQEEFLEKYEAALDILDRILHGKNMTDRKWTKLDETWGKRYAEDYGHLINGSGPSSIPSVEDY